jgi:hypothetical protein
LFGGHATTPGAIARAEKPLASSTVFRRGQFPPKKIRSTENVNENVMRKKIGRESNVGVSLEEQMSE